MNFVLAFALAAVLPSPVLASLPRDEGTVITRDETRLTWSRHDLWNGVTRPASVLDADTLSHAPYVPADRIPTTSGKRIVGTDDLRAVTETTNYPYSAFVRLFLTFPSGMQGSCSGTMVSPSTVVTAAHCVFSHQHGWPIRVQVAPGIYGTVAPFGLVEASAVAAHDAFVQSGDPRFDIGVVQLDGSDIGYSTGWLGVAAESDMNFRRGDVSVAGYPGDRDQGLVMYQQSGPVLEANADLLVYEMDSYQGMSGGPVFRMVTDGAVLVGVHAWESGTHAVNGGTRITQGNLSLVLAWIADGPHCEGGDCERTECSEGECSEGAEQESTQLPVSQPAPQPAANQSPSGWTDSYGPQNYQLGCSGGGSGAFVWPLLALVGFGVRRACRGRSR